LLVGCLLFLLPSFLLADDALHQKWDELLRENVHHGLLDYSNVYREQKKLDAYLKLLADVHTNGLGRDELLALYINAYNSCTVKLILVHGDGRQFPHSIKDTGSFFSSPWSKKICIVGGQQLSLDEIEHEIIRPQFKDNRIHFAVNCASMSCPALLDEAYLPSKINEQLDTVTKRFLADEHANYLQENILYVSKIFKWYGDDFPDGVTRFFKKYGPPEIVDQLENSAAVKIDYIPYDWSLNRYNR